MLEAAVNYSVEVLLAAVGSLVAVVVDPCSSVCYTGSYRLSCGGRSRRTLPIDLEDQAYV